MSSIPNTSRRGAIIGFLTAILSPLIFACSDAGTSGPDTETFYRSNPITIIVGFSPGGGHDAIARLLTQYWPRYIPGEPKIIVQHMPGAGSLVAANYIFNVGPRDGTVVGLLIENTPVAPLLGFDEAQYDPSSVGWIGSLADSGVSSVVFVRSDSKITKFDDALKNEVVLGAAGFGNLDAVFPPLINDITGSKFKVIRGYPGTSELSLAIERGEINGRAGTQWSRVEKDNPDWITRDFVRPMLQLSATSYPALDGVPLVTDYAKTEADRQTLRLVLGIQRFSRLLAAAPGIPADRLQALRDGFDAVARNPDFRAEYARLMNEDIAGFVSEVSAMPQEVRNRVVGYMRAK